MHYIALLLAVLYILAMAAISIIGGIVALLHMIIDLIIDHSRPHLQKEQEKIKHYSEEKKLFIEQLKENNSIFEKTAICQEVIDKIKTMPGDQNSKSGYILYWNNRKQKAQKEKDVVHKNTETSVEKKKNSQQISDIQITTEVLSDAILNNTLNKSLLQLNNSISSGLFGYDDWKQDAIDYVSAVHLMGQFKNRYSAMQSAVFVANKIILEFLDSDGETDFFTFVQNKCNEMPFSTPSEKIVYDINGEIAKMISSGAKKEDIYSHIENNLSAQEKGSRPRPEDIYPLENTGDAEIDSFASLAKAVSHIKLKHLHISDDDIDESIKSACREYKKRDWKSFEDYFTHAFQFGYLTERRFQRLYNILYNIAKAKEDGLSNVDVLRRIGNLYVIDKSKDTRAKESDTQSTRTKNEISNKDIIPYHYFSKEEHSIIAVASRVTRALYHHRLYKKTAPIAIELINNYHKLPSDQALPEKQYLTVSASILKRDNSLMSGVYDTIVHIIDCIFSGKNENDTYEEIKRDELGPLIDAGLLAGEKKRNVSKEIPVAQYALRELKRSIDACCFPPSAIDLIPLADHLDKLCFGRYETKLQYFKTMLARVDNSVSKQYGKKEIQVMKYLIQCKINDVPDVSFRALVVSRFPELFRDTNSVRKNEKKAKR